MTQRLAYGGYVCVGCGRICGHLPHDDRCTDCGPVFTAEEIAEREADAEAALRRRKRLGLVW